MIEKFISCGRCNNGYLYKIDSNKETIVIPCNCLQRYKKKSKLEIAVYESKLPRKVLSYNINSYIGVKNKNDILKFKKYVKDFYKKFKSVHLYLWSKQSSTQKTTIAAWIGKNLLEIGFSVQFILMNDLLKLLQSVDFKNDLEDKVLELMNCDFLIIDDSFDPNKVTIYKSGYQLAFLDSFLRKRIEQLNKAICFTSNIPIIEIGKIFNVHIEKLIQRSVIPFHFRDEIDYNLPETIFND